MNLNLRNHILLILGLTTLVPSLAVAGVPPLFEHTLKVSLGDPVVLDIAIASADITVAYSHEGQVSVYSYVKEDDGDLAPKDLVDSTLRIEQVENHVTVRDANLSHPKTEHILYRFDVPRSTVLNSTISGSGRQAVLGIYGPITLASGSGDIEGTWIRGGLFKASTGRGKITLKHAESGVDVETRSGSITMTNCGPSIAAVKQGIGTIEIAAAQGSVKASTDKGPIHIKAENWDDWDLKSASGHIRVELPPRAKFDADVSTDSGEILIERTDMEKPEESARQYHQKVNGGGKRIQVRSDEGGISIE